MLAKKNKIDTSLFKEVMKSGKAYYFDCFSIRVLKKADLKNSRIAFVAPKKQFKKAVERNSAKRKGFNIIKNLYEEITPAYALIFFLKKEAEQLTFDDFQKEIISALKRVGVLK